MNRVATFDFQIAIWGYDDAGSHTPIDEIWERKDAAPLSFRGIPLWDRNADWLTDFWIGDERAPLWHALPYVAKAQLAVTAGMPWPAEDVRLPQGEGDLPQVRHWHDPDVECRLFECPCHHGAAKCADWCVKRPVTSEQSVSP